ncbi:MULTISPECIES: hypothetical protein [Vibrio]|uniref:ribosome modulation factor n=1 Tax=Vibrio TaxID=662 RepID=UPI001496088B|nr:MULTISPECIES: hypothetical protein [Vibrio]USD58636.1 hypothetical protein J4N44_27165 [Vibrio sp. SCSIO 43155]
MNEEERIIYEEGYNAFLSDVPELSNPYDGISAEYWSDGWEDAKEDQDQQA